MRVQRITPACAGKRLKRSVVDACTKDHPRVCGEKKIPTLQPLISLGSPPRVRGKVPCSAATSSSVGITPACAGKRKSFQPLQSIF